MRHPKKNSVKWASHVTRSYSDDPNEEFHFDDTPGTDQLQLEIYSKFSSLSQKSTIYHVSQIGLSTLLHMGIFLSEFCYLNKISQEAGKMQGKVYRSSINL